MYGTSRIRRIGVGATWRRMLCSFGAHEWWWMYTVTSDGIKMVRYQCFHCHKVKVKRG